MEKTANSKFTLIFLLATLCITGGFYSPVCFACAIALFIYVIINMFKNGEINIGKNIYSVFILIFVFGYLITAFWGIDKYNSILGFAKFLPLLPFGLIVTNLKSEEKEKCLDVIPYLGAVMTVVSFIGTQFEKTAFLFSVNGRISGFFMYSNTFALFLILGIIIIAYKEKLKLLDYIILSVVLIGVFLTGSRTSFVLLAVVLFALLFLGKNKSFKLFSIAIFVVAIVLAVVVFSKTGKYGSFARFLTISTSSGTLLGRLLYFKDAIRVIIKHPFGLGYMGYYFSQGSFQTGVYSNQYVHNELLQVMLDIGWIPALLGVVCIVKALFCKKKAMKQKVIIFTIVLHSMMDFDFQYLGILFILMLCLDFDENKISLSLNSVVKIITTVIACVCVIISAFAVSSDTAYLFNKNELSASICKSNTMAQLERLIVTDDIEKKLDIANCIIDNNEYVSNAYSARALYYYSEGDIQKVIVNKELAIKCNKYYIDEYIDYASMLINVISAYSQMGDYDSASYCVEKLNDFEAYRNEVIESTDEIAYKLTDKPNLELPKEIMDDISMIIS